MTNHQFSFIFPPSHAHRDHIAKSFCPLRVGSIESQDQMGEHQIATGFFITMELYKISPSGKTITMIGEPHPLETKHATIARHRYILFESLGRPEITPCHWCKYPLPWKVNKPNAMHYVICTDFLDFNKSNLTPSNLVPSCFWCCLNREWAHTREPFWTQCREQVKDTPPHQRPNLEAAVRFADLLNQWDHDARNFMEGRCLKDFD